MYLEVSLIFHLYRFTMTDDKKNKPKIADVELEKLENQFNAQQDSLKSLSLDKMNEAPLKEIEPQTKLAQSEIEKSKEIYLKPSRTISSKESFNEKWRSDYNFSKEYVQFIAENKEIIGETIEIWTKSFPGIPAEFWKVPVNKPIWGPRYLAERIRDCKHHRLVMQQNTITSSDGMGQYYGTMAVDTTIERLTAIPVSTKKSVFMGAHSF